MKDDDVMIITSQNLESESVDKKKGRKKKDDDETKQPRQTKSEKVAFWKMFFTNIHEFLEYVLQKPELRLKTKNSGESIYETEDEAKILAEAWQAFIKDLPSAELEKIPPWLTNAFNVIFTFSAIYHKKYTEMKKRKADEKVVSEQ